ncbi:MAG: 30S ribosomal protein S6 [Alphaproteobacteria bacterium]
MPYYENVFIARQDISSQQVDSMIEVFSKLVSDNGGEVPKTEYWGVRGLTYHIKKNRKGHYVLMNLDAPSDAVQELERNMRIHEDVIRYMTVRVDELEEGPSAMMQSRSGRGDRGDRSDRGGRSDRGDRGDRGGRYSEARPGENRLAQNADSSAGSGEAAAKTETTESGED